MNDRPWLLALFFGATSLLWAGCTTWAVSPPPGAAAHPQKAKTTSVTAIGGGVSEWDAYMDGQLRISHAVSEHVELGVGGLYGGWSDPTTEWVFDDLEMYTESDHTSETRSAARGYVTVNVARFGEDSAVAEAHHGRSMTFGLQAGLGGGLLPTTNAGYATLDVGLLSVMDATDWLDTYAILQLAGSAPVTSDGPLVWPLHDEASAVEASPIVATGYVAGGWGAALRADDHVSVTAELDVWNGVGLDDNSAILGAFSVGLHAHFD